MAIFGFKELATSNGLNTKVLLKTEQGQLVNGTVNLGDSDSLSGDLVTNIQKTININKSETFDLLLNAGDQIELKADRGNQVYTARGDGIAVLLNTIPFDLSATTSDIDITLIGSSDTEWVELQHNDSANGIILNGNAILLRYHVLRLRYIASLDRVIEISRNF